MCPGLVQRLVTISFYFSLALTHVSGHGSGLRAGQKPHLTRRVVYLGLYGRIVIAIHRAFCVCLGVRGLGIAALRA